MENTNIKETANADFVKFLRSLDDENPCSSCKLRIIYLEMLANNE